MKFYAPKYKQLDLGLLRSSSKMLDGNVLLRQECDEVPEETLSCPDRIMEVFINFVTMRGHICYTLSVAGN